MILGISGKIGSGKDTVASIIQYLTDHRINTTHSDADSDEFPFMSYEEWLKHDYARWSNWKVRKFANKLKEHVASMLGIDRADLEKEEVKNRILGEEWQMFDIWKNIDAPMPTGIIFPTKELAIEFCNGTDNDYFYTCTDRTIRWFLQQLGTEAVRNTIHTNAWVNALFADYKKASLPDETTFITDDAQYIKDHSSKWIITDVRFPNELKAVKDHGGISIRISRTQYFRKEDLTDPAYVAKHNHPSETSLDHAEFDYTIDNNGTIDKLIQKVREILIKEKIIK